MESLNNSIENFVSSVNEDNFKIIKDNWLIAYKSWQYIEMFDIGKAEEINFVRCGENFILPVADGDLLQPGDRAAGQRAAKCHANGYMYIHIVQHNMSHVYNILYDV